MKTECAIIRAYDNGVVQDQFIILSKSDSTRQFGLFFRQKHIDSGKYREYYTESFVGGIPKWFTEDGLYNKKDNTLFKKLKDYNGVNGIGEMSFRINDWDYRLEPTNIELS